MYNRGADLAAPLQLNGKALGRQRVVQRQTSLRLPTFTMVTSFVESSNSRRP